MVADTDTLRLGYNRLDLKSCRSFQGPFIKDDFSIPVLEQYQLWCFIFSNSLS
ncbi:hypothetical protein Q7C36_008078 [Tachysurus vachellii]|uniref:Uncharacterized protein n=1 Tax=Tachysurus vachellii TaxID=175792 RepID=A0AA88N7S1_TACVA|nr:hypothetical protein Q7C36_008078 [Tachysurus vachellii]